MLGFTSDKYEPLPVKVFIAQSNLHDLDRTETNADVDFRFGYIGRDFDEETGQYYYRF